MILVQNRDFAAEYAEVAEKWFLCLSVRGRKIKGLLCIKPFIFAVLQT